MDTATRARVRALCEAATPGPWQPVTDALIVGAVNALRPLLDALDAAERERDEARAQVAFYQSKDDESAEEIERLKIARDAAENSLDDALAESERLRVIEDALTTSDPIPWTAEDAALADGDRRALDAATRERDEARAVLRDAIDAEREACARRAERARQAEDRLRALTPSREAEHAHGAAVAEAIRDAILARGAGGGE